MSELGDILKKLDSRLEKIERRVFKKKRKSDDSEDEEPDDSEDEEPDDSEDEEPDDSEDSDDSEDEEKKPLKRKGKRRGPYRRREGNIFTRNIEDE